MTRAFVSSWEFPPLSGPIAGQVIAVNGGMI